MIRFHPHALLLLPLALAWATALGAEEADWYPSRFGADDRIGAANHLSPEIVRHAARLVTTGKAYSLGMEVAGTRRPIRRAATRS